MEIPVPLWSACASAILPAFLEKIAFLISDLDLPSRMWLLAPVTLPVTFVRKVKSCLTLWGNWIQAIYLSVVGFLWQELLSQKKQALPLIGLSDLNPVHVSKGPSPWWLRTDSNHLLSLPWIAVGMGYLTPTDLPSHAGDAAQEPELTMLENEGSV